MSERSRLVFMAKYGNADAITRLVHSKKFTSPEMLSVMKNPSYNKRHHAALFDLEPGNRHVSHEPLMVALAQHPWSHPTQLQKLVEPHQGYPFRGTEPHRWPEHARIAKSRLDTWHLDHDEE